MKKLPFLGLVFFWVIFLQNCTFTQKIKDGTSAYERKQYAVAIQLLPTDFEKAKNTTERQKIAFMLADSYRVLNDAQRAKDWFFKAYELGYGAQALQQYAFSLKELQAYNEAGKAFEDLIAETGEPFIWRKEVAACNQAQTWLDDAKSSDFKIEKLSFNTNASEYAATIFEGNQLVFTSDRTASTGEDIYNWTGEKFVDLFKIDLSKGAVVAPFDPIFNSPYNDGTIAFNQDFTEAFFTRCGSNGKEADDYCLLMYSTFNGGRWAKPEPLPFLQEKINYFHPTLSADGNTLYFAANFSDGFGGYDIAYTTRTDGEWAIPELLGTSINTEGNELFPFLDQDTLYFSSDFHVGMGGLDVFKTFRSRSGRWSPLQNLKAPINSGADDFAFSIDNYSAKRDSVLKLGYFTSNRSGNDDIFKFEKVILPPPPLVVEPPTIIEDTVSVVQTPSTEQYQFILILTTIESVYNTPDDPSSGIKTKQTLPNSKVQVNFRDTSFTASTDANGELSFELELGQFYNFFGSKTGYLNASTSFSSKDLAKDPDRPIRRFRVELELNKAIRGKEFTLENIYYDFNKFNIRTDARPTLDALTRLLRENPSIKIQLASHTDCRGNNNYNEWLSQKRAESAVTYLIERGISFERLSAKGYGEAKPAVNCECATCTEDQHQANRRTTFTILD